MPASRCTVPLAILVVLGAVGAEPPVVRAAEPPGAFVLPADRATEWRPGVTYDGGIPQRSEVCATVEAAAFGDGARDASAAIRAAIVRCPPGRVVRLSAGTFTVNDLLLVDRGITVRGAGAGRTVLRKTDGARPLQWTAPNAQPIFVVGPSRWPRPDEATSRELAADGQKGARAVTVSDPSGLAPGQVVLLDELSGAGWQPDPLGRGRIWASPDWRVTWQLHDPPQPWDDPLVPGTPTGGNAAAWFCRRDRPTAEVKEVESVHGRTVTFTTPLHISFRTAHRAELTRYTGQSAHVRGAGIEDLTVEGGSDGAIRFECASRSWARNVEVTRWLGEGVAIDNSFRVELRDSYLHDAVWPQPGGAGYAISLALGSAEALVENSIVVLANKVLVARAAGAGSVVGYNYMEAGLILGTERWIEVGLNASHLVGSHHVLFEGNDSFNFDSDKTHGSATHHTVFRNWLRGTRRPFASPRSGEIVDDAAAPGGLLTEMRARLGRGPSGNGPRRCAGAQAYSYGMSFVGNVLGERDRMDGWTYDVVGPRGMSKPAVFLLGWDDVSPQPYDARVAETTLRQGNWDWLRRRQAWDGPPARLPDSLYLPGKPAFFGASPWPWVDPSTGAVHALPARARLEAGTPNVVR